MSSRRSLITMALYCVVFGLVFLGVFVPMYYFLVAIGFSGFWATVGAIVYFISIFLVLFFLESFLSDDTLEKLFFAMILAPSALLICWCMLYPFIYVFPVLPEIFRRFVHLLVVFFEVVLPYIRNAEARKKIEGAINSLKEIEAKCTDIIRNAPLGKLFLDPVAESIIWPIIMAILISILKKLFK